jgi:hypothetical protein
MFKNIDGGGMIVTGEDNCSVSHAIAQGNA